MTLCCSPCRNSGVGSLSLLQGIFPTQGLNPGVPHCRQILYQMSHKHCDSYLNTEKSHGFSEKLCERRANLPPQSPVRPALPRRGGEGVCLAGSPAGLPSPQPSGRGPNARATPSPPLRGNSHLSSRSPSPGLSARPRGETPNAQPARAAASRKRGGGGR